MIEQHMASSLGWKSQNPNKTEQRPSKKTKSNEQYPFTKKKLIP